MSGSQNAPIQYRADIDGLRALAVLAVVAYHAEIPGFPGGFVGVDVFFVISGFLITRLLLGEAFKSGRISFAGFYGRRMRRLLPALIVVILATIALNVFLVPGFVDARKFAASIRWSAFGLANVFFKRNTGGYFDGATNEMPLLHFWSLGVEEQFYLFWPLLLTLCTGWGLRRRQSSIARARRTVAGTLAFIVVLSFIGACFVIHKGRTPEAFYLMPYRAWELGIGALLACLPGRPENPKFERLAGLGSALGLGMIGAAVFWFSKATVFPGAAALLPVLGTALLLWAGARNPGNPVSSALSFKPLVRIGVLSYGWYLWHWPLLVTARLWNLGGTPDLITRVGLLVLGLLLAEMSLRWIETPIRQGTRWRSLPALRVVMAGLTASALVLIGSFGIHRAQDLILSKQLGSGLVRRVERGTGLAGRCFSGEDIGTPACTESFSPKGKTVPFLAVWGDSHACSYFAMLEKFGREHGLRLTQYCEGQTPPLAESGYATAVLKDLRRRVREVSPAPVSVVLASRWVSYTGRRLSSWDHSSFPSLGTEEVSLREIRRRLTKTFVALKAAGISRVLVMLPYAEFEYPTLRCLLRSKGGCATPRDAIEQYRRRTVEAIRDAAKPFKFVRLVDPLAAVCDRASCPQVFHGIPVVTDTNHPTVSAAQSVGDHYASDLNWLIRYRAF